MPAQTSPRDFALDIVKRLRAAGFEAVWAGGCVRDELLGLTPKDYDVATSATPDQIRELFGRRRTLPIGAAFGVVTVLGPRSAGQIEVATFRTDAAYSDGRHPDSVTFTDAEHDAQRRDFTINGLFYDPISEQVIDYVEGQKHLENRTIRAIGDARLRLNEDKLRMLRAVRFAATFDFTIEPETFRAIQEMASQITAVSAERIGAEIRRMLVDPNRVQALELLRQTGLLAHVLPELDAMPEYLWPRTLQRLQRLECPSLPLAFATALLSIEHSHIPEIGRRLRFTNKEIDRSHWLATKVSQVFQAPSMPWFAVQRLLTHDGAAELIALAESFSDDGHPSLRFCRERLAWPPARLNPPPLLDGADLIRHGLAPGPQFSDLLERVRDAQLMGAISTTDEALALVDSLRMDPETLP